VGGWDIATMRWWWSENTKASTHTKKSKKWGVNKRVAVWLGAINLVIYILTLVG